MIPLPPTITREAFDRALKTATGLVVTRYKGKRLPVAVDIDDLIQAARMGVWIATGNYQPSKGRFETFAVDYGLGYAQIALGNGARVGRRRYYADRRYAAANEGLSLDERVCEDGEPWYELTADPRAELAYLRCETVDVLNLLPPVEREVAAAIILNDASLKDAGAAVGLTRFQARKRFDRAGARLKEALA